MNQLVADLSLDLRHMRDMVRSKQALGVSLNLLQGKSRGGHFPDEDNNPLLRLPSPPNSSIPLSDESSTISTANQTPTNTPPLVNRRPSNPQNTGRGGNGGTGRRVSSSVKSKTANHALKTQKRGSSKELKGKKRNVSPPDPESDPSEPLLSSRSSRANKEKAPGCFGNLFRRSNKRGRGHRDRSRDERDRVRDRYEDPSR